MSIINTVFSQRLSVFAGFVLLVASSGLFAGERQREVAPMPSLAPMVEEATPAVVNIAVTRTQRLPEAMRFFNERDLRRFFEGERGDPDDDREAPVRRSRAAGSGVIIDASQGYIVTNHHVVAEADSVTVGLQDGRQFEAELVGSDARTDLALLQIDAERLSELPFADIADLRIGDYVVAVGNPFGIGQTVTSGIVSALGRGGINNENYEDFIQTDAAINVGNSGGALLDLEGRLVGINTAIISGSGTSAGVGFAVPVDMVATVVEHLERDGVVRRGQLGIMIRDYTPAMEEALQLGAERGALVTQVAPGTAADEAGIEVSDLVTGINGREVTNGRDLRNAVGLIRLDEEIRLTVYRDGERQHINATIRSTDEEVATVDEELQSNGRHPDDNRFHGARLQSTDEGVAVVDVDRQSRAWAAGLRPGDVIVEVNRQSVSQLRNFNELAGESGRVTALSILREDQRMLIIF